MGAAPALAAGVDEIAVASPPGPDGRLAPVVLAACAVAGVSEVHRMGGAQAIAALAYGTATIDPVEKIVGPGNIYVSAAKRLVSDWVGTDTEAGPTEIMVIADASADAQVIATDLIAQAEHGPHGSHVLVTWDEGLAERVMFVLEDLVARHPRAEAVENALIEGGSAVLVRDVRQALDTANAFAAEHLQLCFAGARDALPDVTSAGAIFVGPWSPVPAGDYAAGTNHVLPTHAAARFSSGLGATDFVKRVYVCELNEDALRSMSPHIEVLAEAEGLPAHADTVRVRLSGDED
jgi:histidinol dehydrogenase